MPHLHENRVNFTRNFFHGVASRLLQTKPPLAQHGNHVCISGFHDIIPFINLDGLTLPDR